MLRRNYDLIKGNTELDPSINPTDQLLYGFDEEQNEIFESVQKALENTNKNILLGGVRGSGKSSLINLAVKSNENLVVKIDCSIVSQVTDILTIIAHELVTALEKTGRKSLDDVNSLVHEITFESTNTLKQANSDSSKVETDNSISNTAEGNIKFNIFNLKSMISRVTRKSSSSNQVRTHETVLQRAIAYHERKEKLGDLIDLISKETEKKVILIFDEIDKQNSGFLDIVFNEFKSLLTSGKSTNIFLVNISQYYHISYGNILESIEVYFDRMLFLRATSFSHFRRISTNEITWITDVEVNYFKNRGINRRIFANTEFDCRDMILIAKSKFYLKLVEHVNGIIGLDDFLKELLLSILNKSISKGFTDNNLNFEFIKIICAEEFLFYNSIQLEEIALDILKSFPYSSDQPFSITEYGLIIDMEITRENFYKNKNIDLTNRISNRDWENIKGSELKNNIENFSRINNDVFSFDVIKHSQLLTVEWGSSHLHIILTFIQESRNIKAFFAFRKENRIGFEFDYLFAIDSKTNGKYILYCKNACWSYDDLYIKNAIDNFIKVNRIKTIVIDR